MATVVRMPQLGESVVEGTILRWLKQPGDPIVKNEPLLVISTDKIDTEVPAPADGVLLEVRAEEGATVSAGSVIATIGEPGEQPQRPAEKETPAEPKHPGQSPDAGRSPALSPQAEDRPAGRNFISPVVARMSAEHGIDLSKVTGTGLGGRITKKDLEAYLAGVRREVAEGEEGASEQAAAPTTLGEDDVLQPLTAMRRAIAQHMVLSKRTSPHVTTICEVDMTNVVRHREANKRAYTRDGAVLTYTAYFIVAAVAGLRAVPEANSRFTDAGIILHRRIHIGVAVALPDGLLVPVIRNADELSLAGIARTLNDLVNRTRNGLLKPDEVQGGTFTITNHGTGGSLFATPIINQPQSGILGVGAIVKRPVVRSASSSLLPSADDVIAIRPMCYLSLTFDHRVMDGAQGDRFLTVVKQTLENWEA
ncbi:MULTISPECIES: dihydrolipoamide acetyltransferase family protein [Caldilinea]|jgi:2-oxoisovalerate dehydrogenase E2 component (dihydrolipoyl transacylase)|uniref:Dihydrolipoamide acetyltransferase component of pyruvate dehydrogenase complex n=1 Tax=Caldilinea aerophila (strain DSM 14535 / JCM 11387 / NBRC 104270 / STL-6-O1) TaxID=926550 RepID=I0I9M1_CALAS|nr:MULTISPECIES: dihydrolipoamide acetyltransferase family protein [Caldilinea]BAM01959.1 branched-chain alpha-keto acid dehydrogenase E2 component [Caldilinea aerophila DSM 14535 = NBRC 104270]GIV75159.1 MAG: dihydrolipoamide acetyltransferase component of pyruvate dehydrogenase complex [Caldilinea sp.]